MLRKTETRESIQLGLFEQEQPDVESTLAGNLDKVILPPLALEIGHDLRLRRLAHVYDRLAFENGLRNQLRACHLQAPRR